MGRGPGPRRRLGLTTGAPSVWSLLALGLVAAAAACADDGTTALDVEAVERQMAGVLLGGHPELVTDVDCGDPDPRGFGPFSCTAVVAGTPVPVMVHRPASDGRVRIESPVAVVTAVDLAGRAVERLAADTGVAARVSCTPSVRVAFTGQSFNCVATDPDGREIALVATLVDAGGGFRLDAALVSGSDSG